jgi:MscS family membrane protein
MLSWLQHALKSWSWTEILLTCLVVFTAWVAAQIYIVLVDKVGGRLVRRTVSDLDDRILTAARRPGAVLVFLIGVYAAFHRYKFPGRDTVDDVLFIINVLIVIATLIKIFSIFLVWYGEKIQGEKKDETIALQILPLTDKILKVVVAATGLVIIFERFGIKIESILISLGVGSLAIGLALQDTLANMFGGFTIMLDRPFRVGDRIQLQSGELGDVQAIGMRSTSVLMPDGNSLIIPNALLVKTIVINHSFPDSRSLVKVELRLPFGSDTEKVKMLMVESASGDPRILQNPPAQAFLSSIGESSLNLVLSCYVRNFIEKGIVADNINAKIIAGLNAIGVEMALPIRSVYLREKPDRR